MARAAILVSGGGNRMRCLLDSAFFNEIENFEIAGVVSSSPDAYALHSARNANVPAYVVDDHLFPNTASYGLALLNMLKDIDTDFVVLAGFTPGLGPAARYYHGRVIGVFPALIPAFENLREGEVCPATLERGVHITGATAYLADEVGKIGRIIGQKMVEVQPEDTAESLRERIFEEAEKQLLLDSVRLYCSGEIGT